MLWIIASILEWINIVLFMAAMGYEIDIPAYNALRLYEHKAMVYYISASIDATLFWILAMLNRKKGYEKNLVIAVFCFIIQVALLLYKIKL